MRFIDAAVHVVKIQGQTGKQFMQIIKGSAELHLEIHDFELKYVHLEQELIILSKKNW